MLESRGVRGARRLLGEPPRCTAGLPAGAAALAPGGGPGPARGRQKTTSASCVESLSRTAFHLNVRGFDLVFLSAPLVEVCGTGVAQWITERLHIRE